MTDDFKQLQAAALDRLCEIEAQKGFEITPTFRVNLFRSKIDGLDSMQLLAIVPSFTPVKSTEPNTPAPPSIEEIDRWIDANFPGCFATKRLELRRELLRTGLPKPVPILTQEQRRAEEQKRVDAQNARFHAERREYLRQFERNP